MTDPVAITGKAGSGKTTAANVLVRAGWVRVKFADPLKDMLRAMGLTDRHIEGDLKEVPCDLLQGRTPRYAMQTLGTEWGREIIGAGVWTGIARRKIGLALAAGLRVVVDDCRFEDEAQVIRDLGGTILGISREGSGAGSHTSEAGVTADIDWHNSGTEAELRGFMAYVFLAPDALKASHAQFPS